MKKVYKIFECRWGDNGVTTIVCPDFSRLNSAIVRLSNPPKDYCFETEYDAIKWYDDLLEENKKARETSDDILSKYGKIIPLDVLLPTEIIVLPCYTKE